MARSCWSLLGIRKGATERDIKIAYARRLKVTRPEDNPEAFQRLVEARDRALGMARQYSAELPLHTEQVPPVLADDTTTDDAPKARKRKTKRARKATHDQSGKDSDAAKLTSVEATETIVNLLESECSEEGIAAFDQAMAILVAASISERLSSEEQLLWSVGGLAERRWPDPDTQSAEPRHPTSAVRYMVAVLAEEFGWLEDERRVASISSWYSPRLVDFLREATLGPRAIVEPKKQPWYNEPSSIWFLVFVAFFLIKVLAATKR